MTEHHVDLNVQEQTPHGNWVPSTPLPLYEGFWLWRRCRCECGRVFRSEEQYRVHYRIQIVKALQGRGPADG